MEMQEPTFAFRPDTGFGDLLKIIKEDPEYVNLNESKKKVNENSQPEEGDLIYTPAGRLGSQYELSVVGGKFIGSYATDEEVYAAALDFMEKENWISGLWFQDDHGGVRRVTDLYGETNEAKEKDKQDKPEDSIDAPQNMKTVKEPVVDLDKMDLEDYDKEDFNKSGKEVPSKSKKNPKYKVTEVPKKLENQMLKDSTQNESLYLCNNCFKTFRNTEASCTECCSNIVEKIAEGVDVYDESELDRVAQDMFGKNYQDLDDYDQQAAVKEQAKAFYSKPSGRKFTAKDVYTTNYGKSRGSKTEEAKLKEDDRTVDRFIDKGVSLLPKVQDNVSKVMDQLMSAEGDKLSPDEWQEVEKEIQAVADSYVDESNIDKPQHTKGEEQAYNRAFHGADSVMLDDLPDEDEQVVNTYRKYRSQGKSREEAIQMIVKIN